MVFLYYVLIGVIVLGLIKIIHKLWPNDYIIETDVEPEVAQPVIVAFWPAVLIWSFCVIVVSFVSSGTDAFAEYIEDLYNDYKRNK